MRNFFLLLIITVLAPFTFLAKAKEKCPVQRPIYISVYEWESSIFAAYLHKYLYENLFQDCEIQLIETNSVHGATLLMAQRIDILPEIWYNSVKNIIDDAKKQGTIHIISNIYNSGNEGWFIPQYLANKYPELNHIEDLLQYKNEFSLKEQPPLIYGCPPGWGCYNVNKNLFKAYGLKDGFELFIPRSGSEFKSRILRSYLLKKPFITYYWSPTTLLGTIKMKQLKMQPFNAEYYECYPKEICQDPQPTSFPPTNIFTGTSRKFYQEAPAIIDILKRLSISSQDVNDILHWQSLHSENYEFVVQYFLRHYKNVWKKWLNEDQIQYIEQSLVY